MGSQGLEHVIVDTDMEGELTDMMESRPIPGTKQALVTMPRVVPIPQSLGFLWCAPFL